MAAVDTALMTKLYTFFKTEEWNYMYDRLAGSKEYLLNPANAVGVTYAYNALGDPNGSIGKSYYGDCLWFYTAYYGNLYKIPVHSQASCAGINTELMALASELQQSDKIYAADGEGTQHNARISAIQNMASILNSMYVNLNCDTYLADAAKSK